VKEGGIERGKNLITFFFPVNMKLLFYLG
jgi:hypothetical protein